MKQKTTYFATFFSMFVSETKNSWEAPTTKFIYVSCDIQQHATIFDEFKDFSVGLVIIFQDFKIQYFPWTFSKTIDRIPTHLQNFLEILVTGNRNLKIFQKVKLLSKC